MGLCYCSKTDARPQRVKDKEMNLNGVPMIFNGSICQKCKQPAGEWTKPRAKSGRAREEKQ